MFLDLNNKEDKAVYSIRLFYCLENSAQNILLRTVIVRNVEPFDGLLC